MFASRAIIYAYVGGNPVNAVDPLGLATEYIGLPFITQALVKLAQAQGIDYYNDEYGVFNLEKAMLERLKAGNDDPEDVYFYLHEMQEAQMCEKARDLPDDEYLKVQKQAHDSILEYQKISSDALYHPTVKAKYPDYFLRHK